jgi:hypothetical protein
MEQKTAATGKTAGKLPKHVGCWCVFGGVIGLRWLAQVKTVQCSLSLKQIDNREE